MIRVFFSYSHHDEAVRNELEAHFAVLKREGTIETWNDREIEAGDDVDGAIFANLERADVVLLLVSHHFLASDYCFDREMKRALERHEAGEARVVPIIVEPCDWQHAPIGKLLAVPTDGKPIAKFANANDGYLEVVRALRRIAESCDRRAASITPNTPAEVHPAVAAFPPATRSSNMRVKKSMSDHERDVFRDETFAYLANFFETSLGELSRRNPELDVRFRRNSANDFSAVVYAGGEKCTSCTVRLSGDLGGEITYSIGESSQPTSYNESLRITHDGYAPRLRPLGLASHGGSQDRDLSQEGAAEYFWEIFMRPLQR